MRVIAVLATLPLFAGAALAAGEGLRPYTVEGDAIAAPLTGQAGDAGRGAALIGDRQRSLCVLCHTGPFGNPHLQGNLSPDLAGIGSRLTEAQIRLRVVDMKRLNPDSIMPSYYRVDDGDRRVAAAWRGKPVLAADEIEDLVAYLVTLKD
jgi:L-cysteine S-thiosulfotransferase